MSCGIYRIRNLQNNKCYVGSSVNIYGRYGLHRWLLRVGRHHSAKLQNSWNKYGETNFKLEILEFCSEKELYERESYWMQELDSVQNGYNSVKLTTENGKLIRIVSAETRQLISLGNLGKQVSLETREKLRLAGKKQFHPTGWKHSDETRQKMRASNKRANLGKEVSQETRDKLAKASTGRKHSEESKQLMSQKASTREPLSQEARDKISKANLGRTISEEHKAKLRAAAALRRLK